MCFKGPKLILDGKNGWTMKPKGINCQMLDFLGGLILDDMSIQSDLHVSNTREEIGKWLAFLISVKDLTPWQPCPKVNISFNSVTMYFSSFSMDWQSLECHLHASPQTKPTHRTCICLIHCNWSQWMYLNEFFLLLIPFFVVFHAYSSSYFILFPILLKYWSVLCAWL